MADLESVEQPGDVEELHGLIEHHYNYTESASAARILASWDESLPKFVKVYPRDYRRVIEAQERSQVEMTSSG